MSSTTGTDDLSASFGHADTPSIVTRVVSGLPAAIKPAVKILISRAIWLTAKPWLIQLKKLGI